MTGKELQELIANCESEICCPSFWDELAALITEHEKKNPPKEEG